MIFIKNAILHTMEQQGTFRGDLLAENGKITQIAEEITPPAHAEIFDAQGMHVYPGLIDAHSHIGISEEKTGTQGGGK